MFAIYCEQCAAEAWQVSDYLLKLGVPTSLVVAIAFAIYGVRAWMKSKEDEALRKASLAYIEGQSVKAERPWMDVPTYLSDASTAKAKQDPPESSSIRRRTKPRVATRAEQEKRERFASAVARLRASGRTTATSQEVAREAGMTAIGAGKMLSASGFKRAAATESGEPKGSRSVWSLGHDPSL